MSVIDKMVAAVTPMESDVARADARAKAHEAATPGDWLSAVLGHHQQIETAFANVENTIAAAPRMKALKELAVLLTGHSIAEEVAIYPALAQVDERGHATKAYAEQSAAKMEMGLLENLPPMSQEFLDKLEHIKGAVAHHVYEEESKWFLELKSKLPPEADEMLTDRYEEQFTRYMGKDAWE